MLNQVATALSPSVCDQVEKLRARFAQKVNAFHAREGRDLILRAFDGANRIGDLTFAAYCCDSLNSNSLTLGEPLSGLQSQAEKGLVFARKARLGFVIDLIRPQVALVRTLRGLTSSFGSFNDDEFDETQLSAT
jgi:hypothetical protein